jgi:SET domain-containing protein
MIFSLQISDYTLASSPTRTTMTKISRFTLEVRTSPIDGQGLYSLSRIPARRKIGELVGELITVREARRRALKRQRIHIAELNNGMAIDASTQGNEFKYVNHSCSPNIFMRTFGDRVEFYALRGIELDEELTCDYKETHHEGSLGCRCGSERCRGSI